MHRLRHLSVCLTVLLALCALLCTRAQALSLAYDRSYGAPYAHIVCRNADVPITPVDEAGDPLDLFQDHRVDAAEMYAFEAAYLMRGADEPLYWYPHFETSVVLAMHADTPYTEVHLDDLSRGLTLVLPDAAPAREMFFLVLLQALAPNQHLYERFPLFQRMHAEGRLRLYPAYGGATSDLQYAGADDVYALFSHELAQLIRRGARLREVTPAEGTFAFTKGVLSRTPIQFSAQLEDDLRAAGYAPAPLPSAAHLMDTNAFLHAIRAVNALYQTEICNRPLLAPEEPHERFAILTATLVITVVWGACLHRRVLHHGTRRAVLLLTVMLLLWELTRMVKILMFAHDAALERLLWYLYYVFLAGLSVAILWIAWASDEDVLDRSMPAWLRAVFGANLLLAALILCNDIHHWFFYFTWSAEQLTWTEHLTGGAYAYWTLWFTEIAAALLLLLKKARMQQVLRPAMALPFALFAGFIVYSIAFQHIPWVSMAELTSVTALFFLLLLELCLRTGLMPSNRFHEAFFTHSQLAMQLVDAAGRPVFSAATLPGNAPADSRTSRMEVDGGALLWHEDLSRLHEQQRRLALARDALRRAHMVLREEHTVRTKLIRIMMQRQLSADLEEILARKRPLLRAFREQLMATTDAEQVTQLIRRLNLLASYLKKRCVLFLKGQEGGMIRAEEMEMALSETCAYLHPLGLRVAVEQAAPQVLRTATALALFDAFASLTERAAAAGAESLFCRMTGEEASFLLDPAPWVAVWATEEERQDTAVTLSDRGYALALTVRPTQETEEARWNG